MTMETRQSIHYRQLDQDLELPAGALFSELHRILSHSTPELPSKLRGQIENHSFTDSQLSSEFKRKDKTIRVWYKNLKHPLVKESIAVTITDRDGSCRNGLTVSIENGQRFVLYFHSCPDGMYFEENNDAAMKKGVLLLYDL